MDTLDSPFEVKSVSDAGLIEGIAAGIGNVDSHGDRIMPGAFAKSLAERGGRPVPMLLFHDQKRPCGVWTDFQEGQGGLEAKGRITLGTRDGAEAYALSKDGALSGLSIGYNAKQKSQAGNVRELHAIDLVETSLVTFGSNVRARVHAVKSVTTVRDLEDLLHDSAGMSGRKAKTAAAAAWKAINDQSSDDAAGDELAAILAASAKRLGFTQ